ncbi:MAG: rhodanese-like domain-containing protein [Comamonas sp.]
MTFIVENWYLILLAAVSGGLLLAPALKGATGGSLQPNDAVTKINREKAVIVDVREPEEYVKGHIANAKNIPLSQLEERLPQVAKNKALPVIFVCEKGARAGKALQQAKKLGYEKPESLAGGLAAWRTAGLPLTKA